MYPMKLDFSPLDAKTAKIADIQHLYTLDDLREATNVLVDRMLELISDARDEDVTFQPIDPKAHDPFAQGAGEENMAWTLGHVIVHTTASAEEAACLGSEMARGVAVEWRSRYEVPWESVTTIAQCRHRLEESRRIRLAYLNAFPDEPHLEVLFTKLENYWGALNAVGRVITGLYHDHDHVGQITEIMRQAREKRA